VRGHDAQARRGRGGRTVGPGPAGVRAHRAGHRALPPGRAALAGDARRTLPGLSAESAGRSLHRPAPRLPVLARRGRPLLCPAGPDGIRSPGTDARRRRRSPLPPGRSPVGAAAPAADAGPVRDPFPRGEPVTASPPKPPTSRWSLVLRRLGRVVLWG